MLFLSLVTLVYQGITKGEGSNHMPCALTTCHVLSLQVQPDGPDWSFQSANVQVEETIQVWEKSVKENLVK